MRSLAMISLALACLLLGPLPFRAVASPTAATADSGDMTIGPVYTDAPEFNCAGWDATRHTP